MAEDKALWNVLDTKNNDSHSAWEHEDTGDRIEVSEYEEDGTWDTHLNDRLIANKDEPEEAVVRAQELMEEMPD